MIALVLGILNILSQFALAQSDCIAVWGQCNGIIYAGATCCQSGNTCVEVNSYYYQCIPDASVTATSIIASTSLGTSSSSTVSESTAVGSSDFTTTTSLDESSTATQIPYPAANANSCGDWALVDNVCCPYYCLSNNESESCTSPCSGGCGSPDSSLCKSGTMWGEQFTVGTDEDWHYSRSTHYGLSSAGACGFGLYSLCTQGSVTASWTDPMLGDTCTAFCTAYPLLCQDPANVTLRGNFAAPNGDYFTQFWPSLASEGNPDNYLACGECFELVQTHPNGSDYASGDPGYTDPIVLETVDSCPCDANPKWCCGPGVDHCGEIDFTYGCPLPEGSHHMDLSDIAMGRLQGNGSLNQGVIPIRYKRVPCPKPGNAYVWIQDGAGPYYFSISPVNTNGVGSVVNIEILSAGATEWIALERNQDYTTSRPQERYGAWVLPQGDGPINLPIGIRLTSPNGQQIVNEAAINSFMAPASAPAGFWYLDLGIQFT